MGLVLSALLLIFGPTIEADINERHADESIASMSIGMPTQSEFGVGLELARAATWVALVVMGALVMQRSRWSLAAITTCAALLLVVDIMKIADSGMSFIDLGCAAYGVVLVAFIWHEKRLASQRAAIQPMEALPTNASTAHAQKSEALKPGHAA